MMTNKEFQDRAVQWSLAFNSILQDMHSVTDEKNQKVEISKPDQETLCKNFNQLLAKIHRDRAGDKIVLIN